MRKSGYDLTEWNSKDDHPKCFYFFPCGETRNKTSELKEPKYTTVSDDGKTQELKYMRTHSRHGNFKIRRPFSSGW
jgi:hypothetical protein